MAKVIPGTFREQESHFGLYRTSAGGDESLIVRRKVGEPTDYMHPTSKKLKHQREVFGQASTHYSHLTTFQKRDLKYKIEEVEYIKNHGQTDIKVLQGRALFISKDIRSLLTTADYLMIPGVLCILLVDQDYNPIPGYLYLYYYIDTQLKELHPIEMAPSNYLFSDVPTYAHDYYLRAGTPDYYDLWLWERPLVTWRQMQQRHYKILRRGYLLTSHNYSVKSLIQGWATPFNFTINTCRWRTLIWSGNYEGMLGIGLRDYSGDRPPGTFIFEEWYTLTPGVADPKYFDFTKSSLNLKPGSYNYLRSYRLDPSPADHSLPIHFCLEYQP